MIQILSPSKSDLQSVADAHSSVYKNADPFPHIVFDDFFNPQLLCEILKEFPSLKDNPIVDKHYGQYEKKKHTSRGESLFGEYTKFLMHYLNSQPFLGFLERLTGIEPLLPDPQFVGGGYHEIMPGGFLKIHADFNKHPLYKLDRRINLLIYLNENWQESYGGHFELWDKTMSHSVRKILPVFNRIAIFSTTDFSYHGHPDPLQCPEDRTRKSLALYYYTNGRPQEEINCGLEDHNTLFQKRPDTVDHYSILNYLHPRAMKSLGRFIFKQITPPIIFSAAKKMMGK